MINERLRATMRSTDCTAARLAEELEVDAKTVQRWITQNRTPHRTTAYRAARSLGVAPDYLWPDLEERATDGAHSGEVVHFYPHRSEVPRSTWLDLVVSASERIDLFAYASLFLPESNPESVRILADKAASGVRIRIALGDPDSPEVALRGREEGMPDGIPGRVRMALAYYKPLIGCPGIEFRLHTTALYNSIYRFDDQMMVNQHIYGTYGYVAPILHLRRSPLGDLFTTYERSADWIWDSAEPLTDS